MLTMKNYQSTCKLSQQVTKKVSHVNTWQSLKSNTAVIHCKLIEKSLLLKCHLEFETQDRMFQDIWRNYGIISNKI